MNVLQVNTVISKRQAQAGLQPQSQPIRQHSRTRAPWLPLASVRKCERIACALLGSAHHGNEKYMVQNANYLMLRVMEAAEQTRKLIRLCENTNVDVVHLHNLHGCYIHLKSWFRYLQKANIPVVWTLHDCWAVTGHCAHFDFCGCMQWKTLCKSCPQKHEYPECIGLSGSKRNYRMKERLFTSLPKLTLAAPSQWIQTIAAQSYLQKYPVRVVYNGVDTKVFQPAESDIRVKHHINGKKLLLFCCNPNGRSEKGCW